MSAMGSSPFLHLDGWANNPTMNVIWLWYPYPVCIFLNAAFCCPYMSPGASTDINVFSKQIKKAICARYPMWRMSQAKSREQSHKNFPSSMNE